MKVRKVYNFSSYSRLRGWVVTISIFLFNFSHSFQNNVIIYYIITLFFI
jgi:hypothetical protein